MAATVRVVIIFADRDFGIVGDGLEADAAIVGRHCKIRAWSAQVKNYEKVIKL